MTLETSHTTIGFFSMILSEAPTNLSSQEDGSCLSLTVISSHGFGHLLASKLVFVAALRIPWFVELTTLSRDTSRLVAFRFILVPGTPGTEDTFCFHMYHSVPMRKA